MFSKILIANRGEIACRVIRSCRRLGIATVAVYSEADAGALHVRMADEAVCVGPAASAESYLRGEHIVQVAVARGAQAIHPGYGFLSENERFAQACAKAGVVFIGPPVDAIRAMGSKSAAKTLMEKAGVPLVPGYHGDEQAPDFLRERAQEIGFPVLIKAAAGGGGKGMRVVESADAFADALASCQREARSSFGDDHVLVEKYLQRPRHIEIQVFADTHGNTVHLFERDCSAQRRHQKVIEEAPAPHMSVEQRAEMGRAACDAAHAVGYVGAGTVEFIADDSGHFYFMEMNTRLQVEHPVTEMITGQDLVEWQLRVAAGGELPLTQEQIPLRGHSIEVRLYAEEPANNFMPSIGRLKLLDLPESSAHVRVDTGFEQGDAVSPHYDPMLAKLIVWDSTREQACERMLGALARFHVVGVGNNVEFLSRLIDSPEFRAGRVDTGLIGRELGRLTALPEQVPDAVFVAAAQAILAEEAHGDDLWCCGDGWRLNGIQRRVIALSCGEHPRQLQIEHALDGLRVDGRALRLGRGIRYWGDQTLDARAVVDGECVQVFADGKRFVVQHHDPLLHAGEDMEEGGELVAPMSGKVIALVAKAGETVKKGAPLLVMEAMKMEHTLSAPADGVVKAFAFAAGDQVEEGAELVNFEKHET